MKGFFQILVIVMIATTSGACDSRTSPPPPVGKGEPKSTTPTPGIKPSIPLSLPKNARVRLEDGNSRSGQVVGMDGQNLTIKKGSSRPSLPIDQIDYVKLEGHIYIWSSSEHAPPPDDAIDPNSKLILSLGDTQPSSMPAYDPRKEQLVRRENWTEVDRVQFLVPIDEFKLEDSESGIARIEPEALVPVDGQDVISSGDSHYVVREMRFIPEEGQMKITAGLLPPRQEEADR